MKSIGPVLKPAIEGAPDVIKPIPPKSIEPVLKPVIPVEGGPDVVAPKPIKPLLKPATLGGTDATESKEMEEVAEEAVEEALAKTAESKLNVLPLAEKGTQVREAAAPGVESAAVASMHLPTGLPTALAHVLSLLRTGADHAPAAAALEQAHADVARTDHPAFATVEATLTRALSAARAGSRVDAADATARAASALQRANALEHFYNTLETVAQAADVGPAERKPLLQKAGAALSDALGELNGYAPLPAGCSLLQLGAIAEGLKVGVIDQAAAQSVFEAAAALRKQ